MSNLTSPAASLIFAVTIAASLVGLFRAPSLIGRLAFRPYYVARGQMPETLLTSGFVHADVPHLLFNMFTFWFFAFPMENILGTTRFVILYLVGLLFSSACSFVKHRNDSQYATIGASGAISAVLFAYIVFAPFSKLLIFPIPVPIPAFLFAILYVAYSYWAGMQRRGRINHDAHLCGAVTGLLFVAVAEPAAFVSLARYF